MTGVGGLVFVVVRSMVAAHGSVSVPIVAGNAHTSAGLPEIAPSTCSGLFSVPDVREVRSRVGPEILRLTSTGLGEQPKEHHDECRRHEGD